VTQQILGPAAASQVTAALQNADGTQNIYITQSPTVNALTLTLTNGLGHAVVFPPGTPVAYGQLPAGQSAIYLYLNGLIDNADIANIQFSAPGWTAGTFTGSDGLQYLVIAPDSQVTLAQGDALILKLANVLVTGSPRSGTADILLDGATGVTPQQSDVTLYLNIANPPQPSNQTLDVQIGFETPVIYTGQAQSLLLHLVNNGQTALVPGGTSSWNGVTPTFTLTLVYGAGAGAISSVANASHIAVDISDEYGNVWQPVHRHTQGDSPYWVMQPSPDGGGTVLGTGAQATIEFGISGIHTTLPAGLDSAITIAYVSWSGVPDYNDGSTAVIITKKAGPRITEFTADPPSVPFGESTVQTVLTWDTAHAAGVRFDAPGVPPAQTFWTSGTGPIDGGISVPRGTALKIIAYEDISLELPERRPAARKAVRSSDEVITATATLRISGVTGTSVPAGFGSLGNIVIPPASGSAFLFQQNLGEAWSAQLTEAAILDLATSQVTGTLDLNSLIPSQGGGTQINGAVASPDGKTIHVLASSGQGASNLSPEYYILPLDVASTTYGQPVSLGTLVPSGDEVVYPVLLATPDGGTVYVSALDLASAVSYVYALDAAGYATTGSWTWQTQPEQQELGPAWPVAASVDGSILLMSGWAGLAVIDTAAGFAMTGILNLGQQIKLLLAGGPAVSPDVTRAYYLGVDSLSEPMNGSFLAVDVDLTSGALSLVKQTSLGEVPAWAASTTSTVLSPDAGTVYLVTGADVLTAFDTTSFAMTPYYCGDNNQFTPLLIAFGAQPGVFYATGSSGYSNGTVWVITIS
jgi:hypothetical protein